MRSLAGDCGIEWELPGMVAGESRNGKGGGEERNSGMGGVKTRQRR